MAWNAARSVGTQACRTLFKWELCVPEKYIVKVNTFTYSRWGLGPPRKSIPSAPVSELNPGRSWEPTELVEVSCTYSGSLRNWLCLKNTAERWQPEACIQAFAKVASEATGFFFSCEWKLPKAKDFKLFVWQSVFHVRFCKCFTEMRGLMLLSSCSTEMLKFVRI